MKHIYACLVFALALTSCSQQKFSFRKTIKVDERVEVVKKQTKSTSQTPLEDKPTCSESNPQQPQTPAESNQIQHQNNRDLAEVSVDTQKPMTVEPEWRSKKSEAPASPNDSKKTQESGSGNGLAITGFILSIVGLFIAPLLLSTLAIVFGAIGLKSERRGLAIAALVIGIIGLVGGIIILGMA